MRSALPRIENFDTDTADNRDKRKTLRQRRDTLDRAIAAIGEKCGSVSTP